MNRAGEEGGIVCKKGRTAGQEGDKKVHWSKFRQVEMQRFRKHRQEVFQIQMKPAQHLFFILCFFIPLYLGWWHYSKHSPNQYL